VGGRGHRKIYQNHWETRPGRLPVHQTSYNTRLQLHEREKRKGGRRGGAHSSVPAAISPRSAALPRSLWRALCLSITAVPVRPPCGCGCGCGACCLPVEGDALPLPRPRLLLLLVWLRLARVGVRCEKVARDCVATIVSVSRHPSL
jgi:hypothetical protein